jgi:hypothetical protein
MRDALERLVRESFGDLIDVLHLSRIAIEALTQPGNVKGLTQDKVRKMSGADTLLKSQPPFWRKPRTRPVIENDNEDCSAAVALL